MSARKKISVITIKKKISFLCMSRAYAIKQHLSTSLFDVNLLKTRAYWKNLMDHKSRLLCFFPSQSLGTIVGFTTPHTDPHVLVYM